MRTLRIIFVLILGLGLLLLSISGSLNSKKTIGNTQYNNEIKEIESSPAPVVIKKIGKSKTLYRFSDYSDGIIRVFIKSDAEFYPKGGKIKILPPSGKSWIDEPGTSNMRPRENQGEFIFSLPNGSKAWGVEIWE